MHANFKIGDMAVYPAQGVAEITGIESKEISGNAEIFYVLKVLDTEKKIMVPVSKVASVGLREVICADDVVRVFAMLRDHDVTIDQTTWNRRYRRYVEKLKTGSVFDVAEVVRDLYLLKVDKPLSFGERKMLDTARGLLLKELSVATGRTEPDVLEELRDLFGDEDVPFDFSDDDG